MEAANHKKARPMVFQRCTAHQRNADRYAVMMGPSASSCGIESPLSE